MLYLVTLFIFMFRITHYNSSANRGRSNRMGVMGQLGSCRSRLSALWGRKREAGNSAVGDPEQQCDADTDAALAYEQRLPYMEACNKQDSINNCSNSP